MEEKLLLNEIKLQRQRLEDSEDSKDTTIACRSKLAEELSPEFRINNIDGLGELYRKNDAELKKKVN